MNPRFHVELPLAPGLEAALPVAAARHVQVLRLQPGAAITVFDGRGQDWPAEVLAMGRSEVRVRVGVPLDVGNELVFRVTLAVGMPANDRMDWLVEKATELGAAAVQPLICERSVLRVSGERADRKRAHWQAVAASAAEQCGRAVLPVVHDVQSLASWLSAQQAALAGDRRLVLSLHAGSRALSQTLRSGAPGGSLALTFLSGPEGGLSAAEDAVAREAGFEPVTLGPRVLRAETAPLAALAAWAALHGESVTESPAMAGAAVRV